jgi:hypothetical protein
VCKTLCKKIKNLFFRKMFGRRKALSTQRTQLTIKKRKIMKRITRKHPRAGRSG